MNQNMVLNKNHIYLQNQNISHLLFYQIKQNQIIFIIHYLYQINQNIHLISFKKFPYIIHNTYVGHNVCPLNKSLNIQKFP